MTNPNDPIHPAGDGLVPPTYGLTKREEFAKAAMQGAVYGLAGKAVSVKDYVEAMPMVAELAVGWADALIAELNKSKGEEGGE